MNRLTTAIRWVGMFALLACLGLPLMAQQPQGTPVKKGDPAAAYVPVAPPGFVPVEGQPGVFVKNNADPAPDFNAKLMSYAHPAEMVGTWKLVSAKPVARKGVESTAADLADASPDAQVLVSGGLQFQFDAKGTGTGTYKGLSGALVYGVSEGKMFILQSDPACQSCGVPQEFVMSSAGSSQLVLVLPAQEASQLIELELTFTKTK